MKLSLKKRNELYRTVDNDIMDARIDIHKAIEGKVTKEVKETIDQLLFDLSVKCPLNAINVFTTFKSKDNGE